MFPVIGKLFLKILKNDWIFGTIDFVGEILISHVLHMIIGSS